MLLQDQEFLHHLLLEKKGSFVTSSDLTTTRVFKKAALSILKHLRTFYMYSLIDAQIFHVEDAQSLN